jgi:hypothetical protein
MLKSLTVAAAIMAYLPIPAAAELTAQEATENASQVTDIYLAGIGAGLLYANAELELRNQPLLYCQPRKQALDAAELRSLLHSTVIRMPKVKSLPAGVVLMQALILNFPCP